MRDWLRQYGDDAFWLVVAGIGFTLVVGSVLSLVSLDDAIAFVAAAAVWLVIMCGGAAVAPAFIGPAA